MLDKLEEAYQTATKLLRFFSRNSKSYQITSPTTRVDQRHHHHHRMTAKVYHQGVRQRNQVTHSGKHSFD